MVLGGGGTSRDIRVTEGDTRRVWSAGVQGAGSRREDIAASESGAASGRRGKIGPCVFRDMLAKVTRSGGSRRARGCAVGCVALSSRLGRRQQNFTLCLYPGHWVAPAQLRELESLQSLFPTRL